MTTIAVIDLPNLYNAVERSELACEDPRELRLYFTEWLDLDLLVRSIEDQNLSGVCIFHSSKGIGRRLKISGDKLTEYLERIYKLPSVTTIDAGVPGKQSETFSFDCPKCKRTCTASTTSEKGVDTAIITHLFDTMDYWDRAILISQDADYCPAVAAIRRKGKSVIGAGVTAQVAPALVRECYSYVDIIEQFIREDYKNYKIYRPDGFVDQMNQILEKLGGYGVIENHVKYLERFDRCRLTLGARDRERVLNMPKKAKNLDDKFVELGLLPPPGNKQVLGRAIDYKPFHSEAICRRIPELEVSKF